MYISQLHNIYMIGGLSGRKPESPSKVSTLS